MAVTILYGNGLNRLSNAPSWDQVMIHLDPTWGSKNISSHNVPNTIQYDQIDINSSNSFLLFQLCDIFNVNNKWQNKVYYELSKRSDVNYITTNYDLTLESYFQTELYNALRSKEGGEIKYNVLTYYKAMAVNKKIWHIHGDIKRPESIILGYDHYCKQIKRLDNYLLPCYNLSKSPKKRENEKENIETWANVFFTDDIYIIGLGLGFEELDLWWLLDKWARYQRKRKEEGLPPTNKIVYLDATIKNMKQSLAEVRYKKNFSTVLHDFGMDYIVCEENTWEDAYMKCLKTIP